MAPFYRARHAAAQLARRGRRLVKPPRISQRNLKRFLREMAEKPRVDIQIGPPSSIAVVVPCYKHAAFLPEMFDSVVAQTRFPDEVIFIDDGSPDDSTAVMTALFAAHPAPAGCRYSLLANDRNIGQAASLNLAIPTATSDLIMILNADDYLMHDAVGTMVDLFGKYPGVAMIGAGSIHFEGAQVPPGMARLTTDYPTAGLPLVVQGPEGVPHYKGYNDLNMTHSGMTFWKVAWAAIGGYRPKSERCVPFSDRDFQLRVNAVWPVAVDYQTPFAFWRTDSTVDRGRES
jgi:GT2 family glycosyltransferase